MTQDWTKREPIDLQLDTHSQRIYFDFSPTRDTWEVTVYFKNDNMVYRDDWSFVSDANVKEALNRNYHYRYLTDNIQPDTPQIEFSYPYWSMHYGGVRNTEQQIKRCPTWAHRDTDDFMLGSHLECMFDVGVTPATLERFLA